MCPSLRKVRDRAISYWAPRSEWVLDVANKKHSNGDALTAGTWTSAAAGSKHNFSGKCIKKAQHYTSQSAKCIHLSKELICFPNLPLPNKNYCQGLLHEVMFQMSQLPSEFNFYRFKYRYSPKAERKISTRPQRDVHPRPESLWCEQGPAWWGDWVHVF